MGQDKNKPQPGDLIEIDRRFHQHWALYIGDGYVIHLTPVDKQKEKLGVHNVQVFTRTVTKQLLKVVVGSHTWRINNKSDRKYTPLAVQEISSRAVAYIGKEIKYRSFGSNCERFVKRLRYGDQCRAIVGGEMHILDMRDAKEYPIPGDLIEIKRRHYNHWALYVGDGYVIHVTPVDEGVSSLLVSSDTLFARKSKVKKELLKEVVGNDAWAVNNKYDCHCTPRPLEKIFRCVEGCIGKEMAFDMFKIECDDFVRKLRYGDKWTFVGGEMHNLDMSDDEEYPKRGDLIEIKQEYNNQWALYIGYGYVIYVAPVGKGVPSVSGTRDTVLIRKAKVKKELLKDMVGNKKWRVNKEYDCQSTPLPMQEIIWHAEGCIGKEMEYDKRKFKSVEFLSKLRHVGQWSAFQAAGICRHDEIDNKYRPIPGDLIEIKRTGYQHWVLCLGRGYVIHVTDRDENSLPMSVGSVSVFTRSAMVKKQLLEVVTRNDSWAVNNKYDQYRNPFPVEEIIRRAERQVGKVVRYRLFNKNCEHFVTKLRYGEGVSEQTRTAVGTGHNLAVAASGLGAAGLLLVPSAPLVAAAGVGLGVATAAGFAFSNIVQTIKVVKFRKARRDILEQRCC